MSVPTPQPDVSSPAASAEAAETPYCLWIDEVGAVALWLADEISLGGPAGEDAKSDLPLLANLSQTHARIRRSGERYVLHALGPAQVGGRTVVERCDLQDRADILLGTNVQLRFSLPSAMSGSARLEFASDHRPQAGVDAVVLMEQACLLGPGNGQHVLCPGWGASVVLFRQENTLWCKSRGELFVDDRRVDGQAEVRPGSVVRGPDLCFRVATLPAAGRKGVSNRAG